MVKFYVRRILVDKKMTIDEVPMRWRAKCKKRLRNSFPLLCNDIFCRNLRPKNVEIMHITVILWTCPKGHFKFWHGWGLAWLRP